MVAESAAAIEDKELRARIDEVGRIYLLNNSLISEAMSELSVFRLPLTLISLTPALI